MFLLHRHWRLTGTPYHALLDELRGTSGVLQMFRSRGARHVEWTRPMRAPRIERVLVVLEGWLEVKSRGEVVRLEATSALHHALDGAVEMVGSAEESRVLVLAFESDVGQMEPRLIEGFDAGALGEVVALMEGEEDVEPPGRDYARHDALVVGAFGELGVEVPVTFNARAVPEDLEVWGRTGRAVARMSTRLWDRPNLEELADELGVSAHTASLRAKGWHERYHFSVDGWRSYISNIRVDVAVSFMSHEEVEVEELSEWLGFGSVQAMYLALRRAGWRAPLTTLRGG